MSPSRKHHRATTQDGVWGPSCMEGQEEVSSRGAEPGWGRQGPAARPGAITRSRRGVTGQALALKDHPGQQFLKRSPAELPSAPAIPVLGSCPREPSVCTQGAAHPRSQQLYSPVAKRWRQLGGTDGRPGESGSRHSVTIHHPQRRGNPDTRHCAVDPEDTAQ